MRRGPGRSPLERHVRGSWGDPGPLLRALGAVYGAVTDLRNALWDAGVFRPAAVNVPVISVGGLSIGGSGKTPLTAALARHLADAGSAVAVVTPGQGDELQLHRALNPDIGVTGGRWRTPFVRTAAEQGASVVLLDSGFQHRRLHRDLNLVACAVDHAHDRERLPAGPYRERFSALSRADGIILIHRLARPARVDAVAREVEGVAPDVHVARAHLRPRGLHPANPAARAVERPDPSIAVAGVMWPEPFFRRLRDEDIRPARRIALPDHARYDASTVRGIAAAGAAGGVVCTHKDAVSLVRLLPSALPVWWLAEEIAWGEGGRELLAGVRRVAGLSGAASRAGVA